MADRRATTSDDLAALYARHLQECKERGWGSPTVHRERARNLARLRAKGVVTVSQLLEQLPTLSGGLQFFGVDLVGLCDIHRAWPVLVALLPDRTLRARCADVLSRLESRGKATEHFLKIARRELSSPTPDRFWLEAVILGLGAVNDRRTEEVLLEIFERTDLPGWIRGDAGDKLGCGRHVRDRRTKLYRRCRAAALQGVHEDSIDVQFWSMYVIGSLANDYWANQQARSRDFHVAIPKLRRIAKHDHRLAPGYWWPMSAEAVDTLACLETGQRPNPDAGERFKYSGQRGEWARD
ncbi:MAG TPA: hypothetical protein VFG04_24515 [Planctomycetaceae bacterium]|jgi:hypothetical protein|nr:hypothetical protein [Planctomycetaceae bacterium]